MIRKRGRRRTKASLYAFHSFQLQLRLLVYCCVYLLQDGMDWTTRWRILWLMVAVMELEARSDRDHVTGNTDRPQRERERDEAEETNSWARVTTTTTTTARANAHAHARHFHSIGITAATMPVSHCRLLDKVGGRCIHCLLDRVPRGIYGLSGGRPWTVVVVVVVVSMQDTLYLTLVSLFFFSLSSALPSTPKLVSIQPHVRQPRLPRLFRPQPRQWQPGHSCRPFQSKTIRQEMYIPPSCRSARSCIGRCQNLGQVIARCSSGARLCPTLILSFFTDLNNVTQGYLKAARCYRLLNKLKASRTMLEMAIERGADENTIKAVRTEQRKLQEDRLRLLQDRSRVSPSNTFFTSSRLDLSKGPSY